MLSERKKTAKKILELEEVINSTTMAIYMYHAMLKTRFNKKTKQTIFAVLQINYAFCVSKKKEIENE